MGDRVRWIEHKGLRILYEEYSNLPEDDLVKTIQEAESAAIASGDKDVFIITMMADIRMTDKVREVGQEFVDNTKANGITIHVAILGLSKIQRMLANVIKRDMYFAKNEEDAKEWLVKHAEKIKAKQAVG